MIRGSSFQFSWAGKDNAIALLQMPSQRTLIPVAGESVSFDSTGNAFIWVVGWCLSSRTECFLRNTPSNVPICLCMPRIQSA